jgi:hypothetical protein
VTNSETAKQRTEWRAKQISHLSLVKLRSTRRLQSRRHLFQVEEGRQRIRRSWRRIIRIPSLAEAENRENLAVNLHCTRTGRGSKRRADPYRRCATRRARRLGHEAAARRRLFWGRGRAPDDWAARQRPFWGRGGCPVAGVVRRRPFWAGRREPPAASTEAGRSGQMGQNGFAG